MRNIRSKQAGVSSSIGGKDPEEVKDLWRSVNAPVLQAACEACET